MRKELRVPASTHRVLKVGQPVRFDVHREDDGVLLLIAIVLVRVRFPRIDEYRCFGGQRLHFVLHREECIWARRLDEQMTVVMCMLNERRIHIQQCDPPKPALIDLYRT